MHCANGQTNAGPFDGPRFYEDFIHALRRFAGPKTPSFPEATWFRALKVADEKDRFRFVSRRNSARDSDYFAQQHIYCLPSSDDFNLRNGEPFKIPQIDRCPAPRFPDRRGTWQTKRKPNDNEPRPQTETASQNEIIRITLDETQAAILAPILDKHRAATRITGLLAAVTRSFRPVAGCISVELQVLETDQRTIAALRKITGR